MMIYYDGHTFPLQYKDGRRETSITQVEHSKTATTINMEHTCLQHQTQKTSLKYVDHTTHLATADDTTGREQDIKEGSRGIRHNDEMAIRSSGLTSG